MTDSLERLTAAVADRYSIKHELGAGGMATVYLAHDIRHDRDVALKVLRPELAATLGTERFLGEIRIAARLAHPHILPLHDSGEADGFLYYVMPFVDGESLREKLQREGELPIADAVRILRDVADALSKAHGQGIVHRDIKPDNVMLSDRHAMVTDFGVAKAVSEATGREQLTTAGVALGTPTYMAPEQAAAEPNIDHRADIYALGAVAYELLTGRAPFTGTTSQAILSAHVTQPPEPVTTHRSAVPAPLTDLVMRCLEKKPADRWQSADELIPQLEALATPSGGITPTETRPHTGVRSPRKRYGLIAAVAVVLGIAALGVWYSSANQTGDIELDPNRILVTSFENFTGDTANGVWGLMATDAIRRSVGRSNLLSVVPAVTVRELTEKGTTAVVDLGNFTRAGTAITGSFSSPGADAVQFQVEIINSVTGELVTSIEPVTAPVDSLPSAVATLTDRVTAVLAAEFDPETGQWAHGMSNPPSLDAFRAWSRGSELFNEVRYEESIPHFDDAMALAPDWAPPIMAAAFAHGNLGRRGVQDSLFTIVDQLRDQLTELENINLDWGIASNRGDRMGFLRAGRAGTAIDSVYASFWHGAGAGRAGYYKEAATAYSYADTNDITWAPYWNQWGQALHMAEDYEKQNQIMQSAIARYPDWLSVRGQRMQALAAMGRFEEMWEEVENLRNFAGNVGRQWLRLAQDVHAHQSQGEIRDSLLTLAGDWAREQLSFGRDGGGAYRYDLAMVETLQGNLARADSMFQQLHRESPEDLARLTHMGLVAIRRGDRDSALAISDRLAQMENAYTRGNNTGWRVVIAAGLGDKMGATELLQQAFDEGLPLLAARLHRYEEMDSVRDFGPFLRILYPEGR